MSSTNTFPNANINLQDQSTPVVPDTTTIPLHLPIFATFAEKGPVGDIFIGGSNALQATYGSLLLNERSSFFKHQNAFLKRALAFQQVAFVRIADPAAEAASLVLLATLTPGPLVQYQRTPSGALILTSGNPTPQLQVDGVTPVTQPGITISYSVRVLTSEETINGVATTTSVVGGVTTTTYPIIALTTDAGSAGNLQGFRLFYNPSYDTNAVSNTGSMLYSFQPVYLNTTDNVETPIYDIYNSQTQTFSFMPNAYDSSTGTYYQLQDVINNDYNGLPGLPYDFYVYQTNVGTIGEAILAVSTELGAISPYLINILSAVDGSGNTYEHFVVNNTAASLLNSQVVNYLQGGLDGSLSNTMFEEQTIALYNGTTNPLISDNFRYPFTHIYDSGYTLATKEAIAAIYGLRDDVKITYSTQDVSNSANTAAQDQSTGSSLRAALLLNPESVEFGTQFCRADIYQQCGTLSDTQVWTPIVPATIDRMLKRCAYNSGTFITGEPKGRPRSEVTIFNTNSLNWTPTTQQQKQLSWKTGLNYIQYADLNVLFYPDLLTIYPTQNSLLSSDTFVDYAAVYLKKIIRQQWTIFVGRSDDPKSLFPQISNAIDTAASKAFAGLITTSTAVSQTTIDAALGYQTTVITTVNGSMPNRVWRAVVPIQRAS